MKNTKIFILILASLSFLGLNNIGNHTNVPKTLKGTNWTSQFFHYCNNYHFDTDSTGYSEDGRVVWSWPVPVDTNEFDYGEDEIIYESHEKFKYNISDTILTIEYLIWKPKDTIYQRVFFFNSEENAWISEYEYAYGKEWLKEGNRKKAFNQ